MFQLEKVLENFDSLLIQGLHKIKIWARDGEKSESWRLDDDGYWIDGENFGKIKGKNDDWRAAVFAQQ